MARKSGLGKGLDSLISTNYVKKAEKPEEKNSGDLTQMKKNGSNKKQNSNAAVNTETVEKTELSTKVSTKQAGLVDNHVEKPVKSVNEAQKLDITLVEPNREQPRKNFDMDALEELANSIRQYGILQPLLVKPEGNHYIIIAGERRWRAAKLAGCKEIPAIVRDYSDQEIVEISLIENIQREDLNVIEEAQAYQRLIQEFQYRQEDLASKLSKSRTVITNRLRLLKLTEKVQSMLIENMISEGHARTLIAIEDPDVQFETAMQVMDGHLSVRETERLVKKILSPEKEKDDKEWKKADQFIYDKWEEDLQISMGTKVSIKRKNKDKGHIMIDYYSTDELERLMEMLSKL